MTLLNMIHLSVVSGEQLFFYIDREHELFGWLWQEKKCFLEKKKKAMANGCFFLWKIWILTGVKQKKMNVKARTHLHMLFWELWEELNQFLHGKAAAHAPSGIFLFFNQHTHLPEGLYSDTEPHFEFLAKNIRTCQGTAASSVYTAGPLCTVTELPLRCSLLPVLVWLE